MAENNFILRQYIWLYCATFKFVCIAMQIHCIFWKLTNSKYLWVKNATDQPVFLYIYVVASPWNKYWVLWLTCINVPQLGHCLLFSCSHLSLCVSSIAFCMTLLPYLTSNSVRRASEHVSYSLQILANISDEKCQILNRIYPPKHSLNFVCNTKKHNLFLTK